MQDESVQDFQDLQSWVSPVAKVTVRKFDKHCKSFPEFCFCFQRDICLFLWYKFHHVRFQATLMMSLNMEWSTISSCEWVWCGPGTAPAILPPFASLPDSLHFCTHFWFHLAPVYLISNDTYLRILSLRRRTHGQVPGDSLLSTTGNVWNSQE